MPPHAYAFSDTATTSDIISHCSTTDKQNRFNTVKRKKVSFGKEENNKVHEIIHINDLKQETDTTMIWYSKEEYKQISKHCQETIGRHIDILLRELLLEDENDTVYENEEDLEKDWCIRGLELEMQYTLATLDDRYTPVRVSRISDSLNAVLDEQDHQRMRGLDDDRYLAYVYFNHSRPSQEEAELAGHNDWKEVLIL